jgi:hypothetical protein
MKFVFILYMETKACLFLAGPDHMEHLKKIVEKMQKQVPSRPRSRMTTMLQSLFPDRLLIPLPVVVIIDSASRSRCRPGQVLA